MRPDHRHHFAGAAGRSGHRGGRGGFFGGRFGGAFRGVRAGMRAARMLASGDLQLIILLLLSEKPRHGYDIIRALEEHSFGIYTPSPGMVYPALTYLEEMSYTTATTEGAKKLYSITPEGTEHLNQNRETAEEVWNQLALFGRKLAHFQKQFAEEADVEEHFGSGPSGQFKGEWRQMKSEFRELREELKAAILEKIDSPLEEKKRILEILRQAIEQIRSPR